MTESLKQRVAQNTAIQIIGKLSGTALSLISAGIIFRYLGDAQFGTYTTILSLTQIFGTLMDLGLYVLLIKKLASPHEPETTIHALFTLRVISGVIFLLCAPLTGIALGFFSHIYTSEIIIGTLIATLFAFGISINQLFSAVFQKFFVSHWIALGEILSKVLLLIGVVLVAYTDLGVLGMVGALSISTILSTLLLLRTSRTYVTMRWHWNTTTMRALLFEAWPVAVSVALVLLYFRGDIIILSLFEKNAEPIGIYGAPYKILEVLITFPAIFTGLMLNPITHKWKEKNLDHMRKLIRQATNAIGMLAFPIVAGLLAIPTPIMHLIAGHEFTESGKILQILSLATCGIFFGTLFGYVVVAIDKQKEMMWGYGAIALIALTLYTMLIPRLSIYGAAWVTVFSEISVALIAFFLTRRYTRFSLDIRTLSKTLLSAMLMWCSVSIQQPIITTSITQYIQNTLIQDGLIVATLTVIGAIDYLLFLLLMRATSLQELRSIFKKNI